MPSSAGKKKHGHSVQRKHQQPAPRNSARAQSSRNLTGQKRVALSLHDALPISATRANFPPALSYSKYRLSRSCSKSSHQSHAGWGLAHSAWLWCDDFEQRSEEHTSELQSLTNPVCRLLLAKKNTVTPCSASISSLPRETVLALNPLVISPARSVSPSPYTTLFRSPRPARTSRPHCRTRSTGSADPAQNRHTRATPGGGSHTRRGSGVTILSRDRKSTRLNSSH